MSNCILFQYFKVIVYYFSYFVLTFLKRITYLYFFVLFFFKSPFDIELLSNTIKQKCFCDSIYTRTKGVKSSLGQSPSLFGYYLMYSRYHKGFIQRLTLNRLLNKKKKEVLITFYQNEKRPAYKQKWFRFIIVYVSENPYMITSLWDYVTFMLFPFKFLHLLCKQHNRSTLFWL